MRLPRDVSGDELIRLLRRSYGYQVVRQRGSHVRLTTVVGDIQHHIVVPRHRRLKVGTLSSILSRVARHLGLDQGQLRKELFNDKT